MSDLLKLKSFIIKISRNVSWKDLSKFGSQLFAFCYETNIQIPIGLNERSDFLELMEFAFQQSLITPQNTYLISQLLLETERFELNEELYYLEKKFTKVERRARSNTDPDVLTYTDKQIHTNETTTKTTKKTSKYKTSTKSDVINLFSKFKPSRRVYHRSTSNSDDILRESTNTNLMLTDIQVMSYCSEVTPDEWKQLAVIGFKLSITQVNRIDYDYRTIQDKTIAIFNAWKNLSFGSPYYPSYTKQGLKQALVAARLNGLVYKLHLN